MYLTCVTAFPADAIFEYNGGVRHRKRFREKTTMRVNMSRCGPTARPSRNGNNVGQRWKARFRLYIVACRLCNACSTASHCPR